MTLDVNVILCFFVSQVLATVKNQIEELAATRTDFPELITAAQHWMLARETLMAAAGNNTPTLMPVIVISHSQYYIFKA